MVVPIPAASVLNVMAGKVFESLVGIITEKASDSVIAKLRRDKAKNAFTPTFGEAIKRSSNASNHFFCGITNTSAMVRYNTLGASAKHLR